MNNEPPSEPKPKQVDLGQVEYLIQPKGFLYTRDQQEDCQKLMRAMKAELLQTRSLLAEAEDILIKLHPEPDNFRECLDRGYIGRMLERLGPNVFDPTGRARLILKIRAILPGKSEAG